MCIQCGNCTLEHENNIDDNVDVAIVERNGHHKIN
jgi:hypothetical protein